MKKQKNKVKFSPSLEEILVAYKINIITMEEAIRIIRKIGKNNK